MFRKNAFRITGLPVDATALDVTKHVGKLKIQAELGHDTQPNAAFPLQPAVTVDDISAAIQRLSDPEKRQIDEFFWFWPDDFGQSHSDAAIQALAKGDWGRAVQIWMTKEKHPTRSIVATHNLALIAHISALDWETQSLEIDIDADRSHRITEQWRAAFRRWDRIITTEQLWEKVAARIRQKDDQKLTTGFAMRMREALPEAFAKINAELALAFAELGKLEPARLHIQLIRETAKGAADVFEKAAELVLTPARNRLREQVRRSKKRADEQPSDAAAAARELLEHLRDSIPLFDLFFGEDSDFRNDVFNEVGDQCNQLSVTYQKTTGDNKTCLELLQAVLPLAASAELREQIEKNIRTLEALRRDNVLYGGLAPISAAPSLSTINGIGLMLYGSTDLDSENGSYLATYYFVFLAIPVFPICRYRVTRNGNAYRFLGKAPLRRRDKWHLGISFGLMLSLIGLIFIGNVSTPPSPSKKTGSTTFPSVSNSGRVAARSATKNEEQLEGEAAKRNARLDNLFNELSSATKYTNPRPSSSSQPSPNSAASYRVPSSMGSALEQEKAAIDSERATLEATETRLESLGREVERDRLYLDQTSQYAVQQFNAKVDRYNALMRQDKTASVAFNQKVNNYNAKLRQHGR